jgi:hypothetical protein
MADTGAALAVSSIAIGQTVSAYQFFLPPLREVRQAGPDDATMRSDVYVGQMAAGSVSVGVGVMLSFLTGSKLPAFVSAFIALIIAAIYHYTLKVQP